MAHQIKIIVEDIQQDKNYIRVVDWSVYDSRMPVTNRVLKVEAPHYDFKIVPLTQGGSNTYTTKSLKMSNVVESLPDGMWKFTYSICPNERKYSTIYHFRTVDLQNKIMGLAAKVINGEVPVSIVEALTSILLTVMALKANSIEDYNTEKAYELYADAERKFNLLNAKFI